MVKCLNIGKNIGNPIYRSIALVISPLRERSAIWRFSPGRKMRTLFCISRTTTTKSILNAS